MNRVAVTTDRFTSVAQVYVRAGLEPVAVPCVRVETAGPQVLESARTAVAGADLVIITSRRTLDILWPQGAMPPVAVAAVAASTARAVSEKGGRVVATGQAGLSDLIDSLATEDLDGRVVFPHAAGTDPTGLDRLRALASELEEFVVYRSVPVAPSMTDVRAASFASPSAVTGWHLSRDLDGLVVGAIGPTTGAALSSHHRSPDLMAPGPSHAALARALAIYMEYSQ